jgi:osmotically-inducible protein OsmY
MYVLDNRTRGEIANNLAAANVKREAERRLKSSCYEALRKVTCRVRRSALILSGEVPSYFQKQLAQETVRGLNPECSIDNQLAVKATGGSRD